MNQKKSTMAQWLRAAGLGLLAFGALAVAIVSSGNASRASLRRASSGAISSDVLGWFDSRRSAWVSFSMLKGSNDDASV